MLSFYMVLPRPILPHPTLSFASARPQLSPFPATLTSSLQITEKPTTLSLAFATLTSRVKHKSCVCHSYKKHPGWGMPSSSIANHHTVPLYPFSVLELDCGLEFDPARADENFFPALPPKPAVCLIEARAENAEPFLIRTQDLRRRLQRLLGPPDLASKRLNLREHARSVRYRLLGKKPGHTVPKNRPLREH